MTLTRYKKKRTPEPADGKVASARKTSSAKKKILEKVTRATHPKKVKGPTPRAAKKKASSIDALIKAAPKALFDIQLKPMLATLVDKPFDEPGWLYEIKWDGYRALACMNKGAVTLKSRNDKSFNDKFYPVYQALLTWNINAIVDGEIVVLKESGVSDFGALQNWRSEADGDLMYCIFDILWLEGRNLCGLPLSERREILKSIVPVAGMIRLSDAFDVAGAEFFQAAQSLSLEGIIAKKAEGEYIPGDRTTQWLKIKANKRQEMVIGGYTNNEGSSKPFSSLLVGVFEGEKLVYTGKVGTGFHQKQQREMLAQFQPLVVDRGPFSEEPDYNKPSRFNPRPAKATATWLKPVLVCEVSFAEMTSEGVMRHPSFEGMRVDKQAREVVYEKSKPTRKTEKQTNGDKKESLVKPTAKRARNTLLNPTDETQVREVAGHTLKFSNLSKVYWPDEAVTKRDMLNYYYQVAPFILPYLKDRPQSLNRFPNGITGKSFYQKDVTGKVPDWVATYQYHSSDKLDVDKHFLVPKSEADILLMASLGAIELNPWSSRVDKPDHPDWCIIDLDPGPTNTFKQVIEAALVTRQVLDSVGIPSYCKTSGSTGLHIYIPLGAKYTYEQSKEFARVIVTHVHREIPKYTSIERLVGNRGGKMYLDFLQNRPKATLAAPYSLRPKPGATVSTPLTWDEVTPNLKMKDFTIYNVVQRLREVGDLFKPVLGKGIQLSVVKNID